ncbi:hypothetical protein AVEN_267481-1 [Araneus ventricosus]|uniref:Peptidase aspartic putative domain-containing protein n=1 Tax=Araneus ventricosus TaxID=182803 RepID=A0A4Y2UQ91_ARAVE|nr:hypothetical protein AVEN_267481-1 [Araneus ventricosus]
MLFLKGEVEGEERISLAMSGFGVTKGEDVKMPKEKKYNLETQSDKIPTASMLLASTRTTEALKNRNQKKEEEENPTGNDAKLSNVNPNPKVFLLTFKAKLLPSDKEKTVRVLCDTVLQESYILKNITEEMKYPVSRQETLKHSLFGGVSTKELEIHLGWTLMGNVPQVNTERLNLVMTVTSLFVKEAEIADLWRLDILGIKDPMETSFPLPDNFNLAKKRLEITTEKLLSRNLYDKYENGFQEWLDEGIIEEVPPNEVASYGDYLPNRPVIKESNSATPIRPVFDATAKLQVHSFFKPVFTV